MSFERQPYSLHTFVAQMRKALSLLDLCRNWFTYSPASITLFTKPPCASQGHSTLLLD